ncbi:MAG TPA: flagellar biosynthesis protein FlhA, partial [Actinotalea sp.]|nr:flagellar biosynthesis protein FlhA [Actinotalea sp.]
ALLIAGGAAIGLALVPGMPKLPFMLVGTALLVVSQRIKSSQAREVALAEREAAAEVTAPAGSDTPEALIEQMRVPALEILLAPDLVDLVGSGGDADLLARVRGLRRKIALDLGVVVPPVRTRDSVDLPRSTYVVKISGVEVGRGEAPGGRLLALGDQLDGLAGQSVVEPVFGLPGKWIPAELRHSAELLGATVVDRVSVLITHLGAIIDANAPRLLSREDVRVLVEGVKHVNPAVVDELVPGLLSLGEVQRVLQGLLTERVAIRDLGRIFEALTLRAKVSTDPEGLVEAARSGLGPALAAPYASAGVLRVLTLDPSLEHLLVEAIRPAEGGAQLLLDPTRMDGLLFSLRARVAEAESGGRQVVLVCAPALRAALRRTVVLSLPALPVLSYSEVTGAGLQIETVGVVTDVHAIAA